VAAGGFVATPSLKPSVLRFGIFELDYRSGELRRGGVGVRLPPQPFKVLWLLASRPGEVVSREEIREALWGSDTFVDFDSGLNFCINQIRRALHDSAESPRFIHTLPKRGYRFLATVEMVRPPLDESEMPDLSVSPPGVALVTRGEESEAPPQAWPVVERVRPFRWSAAATARPLPEAEPSPAALRLLPRRRPVIALVLGGLVIAGAAAALAAFLTARTGSTLPTYRRVTFRRGMVEGARFGPDGGIVYSAQWDGEPSELYLGGAAVADARRVAPGQLLSVLASGEILARFDREAGPVMAQIPASGGPARELSDGVSFADWTPTGGGRLAVVRQVASEQRLEYPSGHPVYRTGSTLSHPRISPDGQRVALFEHPNFADDRGALVVIEPDGRRVALSEGWASVEGLAWAADGREVWFTAARVGLDATLHAVTLAGAVREIVRGPGRLVLHDVARDGRAILDRSTVRFELKGRFPDPEGERDLSWLDLSLVTDISADGRQIVFSESGEGGGPGYAVFLRRTDGAPPMRLGEGMASTLSPDGKWVASMAVTGPPRVLLLPTAAGETRVLATPGISDYTGVGWTPDARTIVFAGRGPSGALRLHAQDIDGRPAREVASLALRGSRRFPVDGGGGRVAVSVADGALAFVRLDDGGTEAVPGSLRGDRALAWSPDGEWLYVRRGRRDVLERLSVTTGHREPVVEMRSSDPTGAMGPLSPVITPDGRYYAFVYARRLSDLYVVEGLR
jgi:DNA-binding winged helix-turn-helix (wHTH) protein/Tol biopolymer transport system component